MPVQYRCSKCGKTFPIEDGLQQQDWCHQGKSSEGDETENGNGEQSNRNSRAKTLMIGGALVALPCLGAAAAGFGTAGIAAGSLAAMMQAATGNVAAGSGFAIMQSLGMIGVFTTGATAGGSAAAAGAAAFYADSHAEKSKGDNDNAGSDGTKDGEEKEKQGKRRCSICGGELEMVCY